VVLLGPVAIIFVALSAPTQRFPIAAHLPPTNSSALPPVTTIPPAVTSTTTAPATTIPRPPATTTPCSLDPEGNCFQAGEVCPESLHGRTVEGASGPLTCEDNNGWQWESG
jgi:hypothetical protein